MDAFYIGALIGCGVIGFKEHRRMVEMEQKYKELSIKTEKYFEHLDREREERMKSIQSLYDYQKFKERR